MNTNLKKLAKGKTGKLTVLCVFLVCVIVGCLVPLVVQTMGSSNKSAKPYTPDSQEGERAYVDAKYMSDSFANFTSKEADKLYFALDSEMLPYIVCIPDKKIVDYKAMQDFTFGETDVEPEAIRTYGKLVEIDDELEEMAIEEFNWFWGENVVNKSNFSDYFGEYYLDTAVKEVSGVPYLLVIVIVAAVVALLVLLQKKKGLDRIANRTFEALEAAGDVAMADEELKDIRTRHFDKIGVYLTSSYVISYKNGLIVVPLRAMTGLYGVLTDSDASLVARSAGEVETAFVTAKRSEKKMTDQVQALIKAIADQAPDLEYGLNRIRRGEDGDNSWSKNFYMVKQGGSALSVQQDMTNPDGTVVTANYGLGILGALIGALLGGALWFLVGYMGYIAGIVGFVIIYLAAFGFKKGAKVLTKPGAVIAVLISVLMIFAANYVLYAWQLTQAFEGRYTLAECLTILPKALKEYDLTREFIVDIVVGYVLSLISGFSTLRAMFAKNK